MHRARRFDADRGEFKRLYVRPGFADEIGRQLLAWIVAEAKSAGLPRTGLRHHAGDGRALAIYRRAGFERTEPYSDHPTPGAISCG